MTHQGGATTEKPFMDWGRINAVSWVGPNRWYDAGNERFHPDNVLWISRNTSKVVWRRGPDYDRNPNLRRMGPIIGSHGAHFIPLGLPGTGNLLVFDNGGCSNFCEPVPGAPTAETITYKMVPRRGLGLPGQHSRILLISY